MKKTIYNASFEESQNFVNKKYIETTILESEKKVVRKRFLGVFVTYLLLVLAAFFVKFIEKEAPGSHGIIAGRLNPLIYLVSFILFIYYINRMMDYKNQKVSNSYYFNQTMMYLVWLLSILVFLFLCNVIYIVLGSFLFIPTYIILFTIIIVNRLMTSNNSIFDIFYGEKKFTNNRLIHLYYRITIFAKKYGFLLIIGLYFLRKFNPSAPSDGLNFNFVQKISVIVAPFLTLFMFYFLIAMREQVLQGFYLKKYIEEYRLLYGYSVEEWYGPKSKKSKRSGPN